MLDRNWNLINMAIAAIIILFIVLMSTLNAGAQDVEMCEVRPDGSILCCETQPDGSEICTSSIRSTLTPFVPTSTPVPTVTPTSTPTAVPTIEIRPWKRLVWLPIVNR